MTSPEYYCYIVKLLLKSLESANKGVETSTDINNWLNLNSDAINALEKLTSSGTLTRAKKQKCQTSMTHLLTIQNKLRSLLKTGGRLLQNPSPSSPLSKEDDQSVKWDDVFSAFERRIRSGVISNITHMDIISFMKDAQIIFESKITDALNVYNAIKVNAKLAAEYIIQKSDSVDS